MSQKTAAADVAQNLTVDAAAIRSVLNDHYEVTEEELLDALEAADEVLMEGSDVIYEHYTQEADGGRDEWLVDEGDQTATLYVHWSEEWQIIFEEAGLDDDDAAADELRRATKKVHHNQAMDNGADANVLGSVDAMVVWQPAIVRLVKAGLSKQEARVAVLRDDRTQEEIADELGLSIGSVKSYCHRIDEKKRHARKLLELTEN